MKRIVTILLLIAVLLTISSCGFNKKIYFSQEKYQEDLSKNEKEYSESQSQREENIIKAMEDVEDELGKSKNKEKLVFKLNYGTYTEYDVIYFKNDKISSKFMYKFYERESRYQRQLDAGDSMYEKIIDHDDSTLMIKYKEVDLPDWDYEYTYEKYAGWDEDLCSIFE